MSTPKKLVSDGRGGWKDGNDPIQRWLRVVTAVTCLGVFVYLAVLGEGADKVATATLALGSLLVLLGYEGVLRLPNVSSIVKGAAELAEESVDEEDA